MLLNWFVSSIADNSNLKNLFSSQDLRSLGCQYCTHLLAAGVLRQICDKNAPTENVFKPNLMYYWAHMEAPMSQPVTPGRLQMSRWPPDRDMNQLMQEHTKSPIDNTFLSQNNNDDITDIFEAKATISQLRQRLEDLEYQLEKLKLSAQIHALNRSLEDLNKEKQSNFKQSTQLVCKETQTNITIDLDKLSNKPVINIPERDPCLRTITVNNNKTVDISIDCTNNESQKARGDILESRSDSVENYCKLNKSREINSTTNTDDSPTKISDTAEIQNTVKESGSLDSSELSFKSSFMSNDFATRECESTELLASNQIWKPETQTTQMIYEAKNSKPRLDETSSVELYVTSYSSLETAEQTKSTQASNDSHAKDILKTSRVMSPSSVATSVTSSLITSASHNSEQSKLSTSTHSENLEQQSLKTEANEKPAPVVLDKASASPTESNVQPPATDIELSSDGTPDMGQSSPVLAMDALPPPIANMGPLPGVGPPPPMPETSPLPSTMNVVPPPPPPPMPPMPELGPPQPPMPGLGPPPPPMPPMGPPPPPMPGMGPPPPPMPGMGPPPPPMPGMCPAPPPMPGMGPAPPPMPGMGPPPPPVPGMAPPPPMMPGSASLGPVPFPAPPVGGWNNQRAALRKTPIKPAAPMKPLYWTRILAPPPPPVQGEPESPAIKPLWLQIEEANLDNIEEFTDLFSRPVIKAPVKKKVEVKTKVKPTKILDSKRSQNVGILAQSLHVEFSEIENAIYNFDTSVVSLEALQQIYELRATEEELTAIRAHLAEKPEHPLDRPEAFLVDLSGIPNFAERISCFMFQSEFEDAVSTTMHKLDNLKHTCEFLIKNESLKKLFAIILTLGNYMNGGNGQRGQADGFGLEILAKLKDVKSNQPNVTLLHFIVRVYMRSCGGALSSDCVLPVPEPGDVARAAAVDFADIAAALKGLADQLAVCKEKTRKVIETDAQSISDDAPSPETSKRLEVFKEKMTTFLTAADEKLKTENENLNECRSLFVATVKYYQYTPKTCKLEDFEPKEFFALWTSFCVDFKDIYKKEEQIAVKEKLKEAKKQQGQRKTITQPKKEGGLKARLQKLANARK